MNAWGRILQTDLTVQLGLRGLVDLAHFAFAQQTGNDRAAGVVGHTGMLRVGQRAVNAPSHSD